MRNYFSSIQFLLGFCFLTGVFNHTSQAFEKTDFVEIEPGRFIYYQHQIKSKQYPTLILLNGLTYSTRHWDAFIKASEKMHYNILRYDPRGMGQTLIKEGPPASAITIEQQAEDLKILTEKLGLDEELNLVGLSYGGGLALAFTKTHPEKVARLILMAPFTEPMESQDKNIRLQMAMARAANPFMKVTDDELYGFFLRQNVYTVYPITEPSMYDHPWKFEAVYQMAEGIRKFRPVSMLKNYPNRSVHLMIAEKDQYIPREVMDRFWLSVPESARASRVIVLGSEHKIPEAKPVFAAKWIAQILSGKSDLNQGRSFEAEAKN